LIIANVKFHVLQAICIWLGFSQDLKTQDLPLNFGSNSTTNRICCWGIWRNGTLNPVKQLLNEHCSGLFKPTLTHINQLGKFSQKLGALWIESFKTSGCQKRRLKQAKYIPYEIKAI